MRPAGLTKGPAYWRGDCQRRYSPGGSARLRGVIDAPATPARPTATVPIATTCWPMSSPPTRSGHSRVLIPRPGRPSAANGLRRRPPGPKRHCRRPLLSDAVAMICPQCQGVWSYLPSYQTLTSAIPTPQPSFRRKPESTVAGSICYSGGFTTPNSGASWNHGQPDSAGMTVNMPTPP